MSIRYVERAIWAKGLGKTRKAVLIAIADAVSDNGIGWLLISSLMKKTDLSERAIQEALADMCDTAGGTILPVLERRERAKRSSIFRIHIDRIPQHDHGQSDKEMTADEMWGAGDAPINSRGAPPAPHPRTGRTPPPQGAHPEPSLEPSIEPESPLSLSGEAPPDDFLGCLESQGTAIVVAQGSILEHVERGWEKLVADFPRTEAVRIWNDSRKKAIVRRADEAVRLLGGSFTAFQVWDMIFDAIRGDRWLRGQGEPTRDYPTPFACNIDYILRPKVFARTLEKAATNELDRRASHDTNTGRELGPAEQASRQALARLRAAREPRG